MRIVGNFGIVGRMRNLASVRRAPSRAWSLDAWLWTGTLLAAALAAYARFSGAGAVFQFLAAVAGVGFTATVLGRAIDQVTGRLSANAVGLFQAVTGNIPELIIGTFALIQGLDSVVIATIAGSALNLLLFSNGAAYIAGGIRHGTLPVNTRTALNACGMLVVMVAILVMPAIAVRLHTPAQGHQQAISFIVAAALLTVFVVALPDALRSSNGYAAVDLGPEGDPAGQVPAPPPLGIFPGLPGHTRRPAGAGTTAEPPGKRWPLRRSLTLMVVSGLLLGEEADWLTQPLSSAVAQLHISQTFAGLFLLAVVNNLSQVAPAVRLALHGDADTAVAINNQGALQLILMVAPILMLISPLTGAHNFTLVFSPLMAIAMVMTTMLVVFVVLDGIANVLEGVMLIAMYAVLASLFAWN